MIRWKIDRTYNAKRLGGDIAGGLVAALIALPYGLSMAYLMGLPPIFGVYTSLVTAPLCALLGCNPVLIGGTSSVTVPFIAAAVRHQGVAGAAKVCIAAAVILLIFCVLRLGRYVARVPNSVVAGFSCGIGAMMVISQLRTVFALPAPAGGWSERMLAQLIQVMGNLAGARLAPAVIAFVVAAVATLMAWRMPRGPASLVGVLAAVVAVRTFGWHEKTVGVLALELPPFAGFQWAPSDVWNVLPDAFGLAVVTAVNLLITSRVVAHFIGKHRKVRKADADIELGAYGIANLAAATFGAPTCVGIPARSLANVQCGGTTRLSNLIHAGFLLSFLTLGKELIAGIPLAALAGVTAWTGARLLDWSAWRRLPKMRKIEAASFVATAFSVLVVNAVAAVAIGCSFHVLGFVYRRLQRTTLQERRTSGGIAEPPACSRFT